MTGLEEVGGRRCVATDKYKVYSGSGYRVPVQPCITMNLFSLLTAVFPCIQACHDGTTNEPCLRRPGSHRCAAVRVPRDCIHVLRMVSRCVPIDFYRDFTLLG